MSEGRLTAISWDANMEQQKNISAQRDLNMAGRSLPRRSIRASSVSFPSPSTGDGFSCVCGWSEVRTGSSCGMDFLVGEAAGENDAVAAGIGIFGEVMVSVECDSERASFGVMARRI